MSFPLTFWDISLLLAVIAIILLVTSEMLSPYHGRMTILIDRKQLRNVAFGVSILFLATMAMKIVSTIFTP